MIRKYTQLEAEKKKKKAKKRRVVDYSRFSSLNQEHNSIVYQQNATQKYADTHNMEIVEHFSDEAFSGTTANRPDFMRMINEAKNNPVWDAVLVFDMSRFSRNARDSINYENILNDCGIELISVTELYDNTPAGEYNKAIQNVNNQQYSRSLAFRTRAGMRAKAEEGVWLGGMVPLGYQLDKNRHLQICPHEAEIVKKIFGLYEQGNSYQRIADILNEEGYTNKLGKPFNKDSFREILKSPRYCGIYVWNRRKEKDRNGKRNNSAEKDFSEQVILEGACPAIIDEEQFEHVQEMIEQRALGSGEQILRDHYMLGAKKILFCAKCGKKMVGVKQRSHGRDYRVYRCPNHKGGGCETKDIPADNLEKFVAAYTAKAVLKTEDIANINAICEYGSSARTIRSKLKGNSTAIASLTMALENCYSDALIDRLACLESEKKKLEKQLEQAEKPTFIMDEDNIKMVRKKLASYLKNSPDPEVGLLLKAAIDKIEVDNAGAEIKFKV